MLAGKQLLKDGDKEMQDSRDSAVAVGNVFAQQGPYLVLPLFFSPPPAAGESHDAHQSMYSVTTLDSCGLVEPKATDGQVAWNKEEFIKSVVSLRQEQQHVRSSMATAPQSRKTNA